MRTKEVCEAIEDMDMFDTNDVLNITRAMQLRVLTLPLRHPHRSMLDDELETYQARLTAIWFRIENTK